jgi:hypothetical protein
MKKSLLLMLALSLLFTACPNSSELYDFDKDGSLDAEDCAPSDPLIHPGADDPYGDGIDQDCDGGDGVDLDGDGYPSNLEVGDPLLDCDDSFYPDAPDIYNDGLDHNCDGTDGIDSDGDGVAVSGGDCNDSDPTEYAGAPEICNGELEDCTGTLPDDEVDGDGDGYVECVGWVGLGQTR